MLGWLGFGIHLILSIIFYLLWFRMLCRAFQVSESQPLFHWVVQWTELLVRPLIPFTQRFELNRLDAPALATWLVLGVLQYYVLSWIAYGFSFHFLIILISVIGDGAYLVTQILFYAMLLRFLMHYVSQLQTPVLSGVVMNFTDPLIQCSKALFPVGGKVDIAPIVWIVVLKIVGYVIYVSMPLHV